VDVAYHNKTHGMDVGRLAYYYSTTCEMMRMASLSDLDLASLIIGGACHDYEHQGWNNAYLIETQHEWAVRYNDVSVCENHHIAATFKIMLENKDSQIFENLSLDEFKKLRKTMIKVVIATDMALHFDYLNKFKKFVEDSPNNYEEEDKLLVMAMCIHMSDLTNPTKRWSESEKWTMLVYEEFFVQGDVEKELNLPIGMLNDREKINLAKSQIGFIDFIVQPSIQVFADYLPKVKDNLDQCKENKDKWGTKVNEAEKLKESGNKLMLEFHALNNKDEPDSSRAIMVDPLKRTADAPENNDRSSDRAKASLLKKGHYDDSH
jgi:hypothetical protein